MNYKLVVVLADESARHNRHPLAAAIVEHVRSCRVSARCAVYRGAAGCRESGEVSTDGIEVLAQNMPVRIEVVVPAASLDAVLPGIEAMVEDGIVAVEDFHVRLHRTRRRLIPPHMRVRDVMTSGPTTVSPDTTSIDAIRILLASDFHTLPVVDAAGRPAGIITQGDLIRRGGMPVRLGLLEELDGAHVDAILAALPRKSAADVMTSPVVTVPAASPLADAVDLMVRHGHKRLAVVDETGRLVGMLARFDVFRCISRGEAAPDAGVGEPVSPAGHSVRDVDTREMLSIPPDATVDQAIALMAGRQVQRLAVVDSQGRFLGMVFDRLLLPAFAESPSGVRAAVSTFFASLRGDRVGTASASVFRGRSVGDVMKTGVVTVGEDTPLEEVVRIMVEKGIKRIPVVDPDGTFRGILGRDALLRHGHTPTTGS